jgi:kynurenine formamidase
MHFSSHLYGKAYNGHDARLIDARGLGVLGIEHSKSRMAGRGVLLDIARFRRVDWLQDGEGISNDELDKCAKDQNVEIRRGDFVIMRTGQMERCLAEKQWGGYAGGDAPGVKFENCYWCQAKEIAAICSDTWGVEVRPKRNHRSKPALALGGHPRHGSVHGRNLLPQGARPGLHRGRDL